MRVFALVALAALLAACDDDDDNGGTGPEQAPQTASVTALGNANLFDPPSTTVRTNGTVTWTFQAGRTHNVTFLSAAPPQGNIPNMTNGATASRTFPTAGTFNYTCSIHPGMNGSVTVR